MVASGILLTGGSALMEGMIESAERIFNLPVRLGYPNGVGGLVDVVKNPQYATGVGLIQHAWKSSNGKHENGNGNGFMKGVAKRTKQWLGDFF
jgi:cell division protein FtsA